MLIRMTNLMLFFILLSLSINYSFAVEDTIKANQTLSGENRIVSAGGEFELGFLSLANSTNRYVGLWYNKIAKGTNVWIANRDDPLTTNTGILKLNLDGSLVILNGTDNVIWSANPSRPVRNPVVQLLDSGNVVIREENDTDPENFLWQSFDTPGDTFMPGSKFGWNLETGQEWYHVSWRSENDPSTGDFTSHLDRNGFPQTIIKKGSDIYFRIGPWNGVRFSGMPNLNPNPYNYSIVSTAKELYYHFSLDSSSLVAKMVLNPLGYIQRYAYYENSLGWQLYYNGQMDNCDRYALCGPYGSCNIDNFPNCECLKGFEPKNLQEWSTTNWTNGCVRKTPLSCSDKDGFRKHLKVKLPDTRKSWFNTSMSLDECRKMCLNDCNCTAYANTDVRGKGSGCLLWFNELIDMREQREKGQALYIRMAASDLDNGRSKMMRLIFIPILFLVALLIGLCLYVIKIIKKKRREAMTRLLYKSDAETETEGEDLELPIFSFAMIAKATNNFSMSSKLGEGGFGPVYKGMLDDGKEVAVKRLSKDSRQGLLEFKNEVSCIAKLQHRNLVRLLGCSVKEGERMLIYEYMPNKSLDAFIFDKTQSKRLDWPKRHNIINGIAKGLLYLHQDSRLRIIHRDLKASNILLDDEMNPKISDFGMARIFGGSETGANTTRVVGTYGYMPPEYAIDGIFSVKSDVYSFGVLLLEIVCGKKNRGFTHPEHNHNLLGHVWGAYLNGRIFELLDEAIADVSKEQEFEMFRVIQIGLLCVQQYPAERPNMTSVFLMLSGDIPLPQPKQPGFFTERRLHDGDSATSSADLNSPNLLSVTIMAPR